MNITVYLGALEGNDHTLTEAVRELGTWIGESGHALVYGGSKSGLMGKLAESVLAAGGEVTGVEPQFFIDAGFEYDTITRLIVTKDMTERKTRRCIYRISRRNRHFGRNHRGYVKVVIETSGCAVYLVQSQWIL